MKCPECNQENRSEAIFCAYCGNKLENICPHCKTTLPINSKFCDNCGKSIATIKKSSVNNQNLTAVNTSDLCSSKTGFQNPKTWAVIPFVIFMGSWVILCMLFPDNFFRATLENPLLSPTPCCFSIYLLFIIINVLYHFQTKQKPSVPLFVTFLFVLLMFLGTIGAMMRH